MQHKVFFFFFAALLLLFNNQLVCDTTEINKIISQLDLIYNKDPQKALELGKSAEVKLNPAMPDKIHALVYGKVADIYGKLGDNKNAINYYTKGLQFINANLYSRIASVHSSIGVAHLKIGELKPAIENLLKSVDFFEKANEMDQNWRIKQNLAICYAQSGQLKESLRYFKEVSEILQKNNVKDEKKAENYVNIGVVYEMMDQTDSTLFMYNKAYSILSPMGNSQSLAMLLNNIGAIYFKSKKFKQGEKYVEKSLAMMIETGDRQGAIMTMNNVADINLTAGKFQEAVKYASRAYALSDSLNYTSDLITASDKLSQAYYKLGNLKNAYFYSRKYSRLNDSLMSSEKLKQIAEMETKYESDKKEKEITLLNKDNLLQQSQLSKEKNFRYSLIGIAALVIIVALLLFYSLKSKQRANKELDEKNKKIEIAYEVIEEKQKEIVDSINYAKRIQDSLLVSEDEVKQKLNEHFILFRPKDIVSGDFYWSTQKDHLFYLACCDSTGHGVPGAFMSLLNMGFLSEAINEKNITEPNLIFDYVRKRLISTISKEGQKDGFDGILICVNSMNKKITYAAANNAPILISGEKITYLPCDKMPVGKGERIDNFSLNEVIYNSGNKLFLYTDGYPDQFGGPKGKKFKYKQLEELLLESSVLDTSSQKQLLTQKFEDWKGTLEQVDDVCIIGIHF